MTSQDPSSVASDGFGIAIIVKTRHGFIAFTFYRPKRRATPRMPVMSDDSGGINVTK
jgi:hypothetical protein